MHFEGGILASHDGIGASDLDGTTRERTSGETAMTGRRGDRRGGGGALIGGAWIVAANMLATQAALQPAPAAGATVVVAAVDSSPEAKAAAQFVGDGQGDQEQINAAVRALPAAGGTVQLMAGVYDIRRVEGTLGGVVIDRSHVTLAGQGDATQLRLAADQNVNVVRIIGSDVGHVTICDLCVDANREENREGQGDPNVSHGRFEFCGIKAFRQPPGGPTAAKDTHDITVRNCTVKNSHRLGIMLEGPRMRVLDNFLGNAGSDSVEILTGPGVIRGNVAEITGQTHVAIGSDRADPIIMSDNVVRVARGGKLDIAFRSWAGSKRHVVADNIVVVEPGGACDLAMDIRGTETTIHGNNIYAAEGTTPPKLRIAAGNAVVSANVLENASIEVDDATDAQLPILIFGNLMHRAELVVRRGNVAPAAPHP
jgi:hypothetical protein